MPQHHIVLRSKDEKNLKSGQGEVSVSLPASLNIRNGRLRLSKLMITGATRGLVWVSCDNGESVVLSDGHHQPLMGIFYCDGLRNKTYTFNGGDIWLPIRGATISRLTIRLFDPATRKPTVFHNNSPDIVAHLILDDLNP